MNIDFENCDESRLNQRVINFFKYGDFNSAWTWDIVAYHFNQSKQTTCAKLDSLVEAGVMQKNGYYYSLAEGW